MTISEYETSGVVTVDMGPQRQPATIQQVIAQVKQVERELNDVEPHPETRTTETAPLCRLSASDRTGLPRSEMPELQRETRGTSDTGSEPTSSEFGNAARVPGQVAEGREGE